MSWEHEFPTSSRGTSNGVCHLFGVETAFSDDMPSLLAFNLFDDSFEFVVSPLMDPAYRPNLIMQNDYGGTTPSSLRPHVLNYLVVGKMSPWIDLDSQDETLRGDSETTFKHEIALASRLYLQTCLIPPPKGNSCANYARWVNQALLSLGTGMQLWLRIPLVGDNMDATPASSDDSWEIWNSFRLLCRHQNQVSLALDIISISLPSANSLQRWFGEPVRALIFHTDCFQTTPSGRACLSERHEKLLSAFSNPSIQIIFSGELAHTLPTANSNLATNSDAVDGVHKHIWRPYVDCVSYLQQKIERDKTKNILVGQGAKGEACIWRCTASTFFLAGSIDILRVDDVKELEELVVSVLMGSEVLMRVPQPGFYQFMYYSENGDEILMEKHHVDLLHMTWAEVVKHIDTIVVADKVDSDTSHAAGAGANDVSSYCWSFFCWGLKLFGFGKRAKLIY